MRKKKNPSGLTLCMYSKTEEWERDLVPDDPILITESEMDSDKFTHFGVKDANGKVLLAYFKGE